MKTSQTQNLKNTSSDTERSWTRRELNRTLKEKAKRRARRSFLSFVQYIWWQEWEFVIGKHTKHICYEIDDAIEAYEAGTSTYLDIEVGFRHGKSDLVSRALPAYFLGLFAQNNPDIIITGYDNDLIESFSQDVKDIIASRAYA